MYFSQKSPSCHFLTYKLQWRDKVSWNLHLKDKVLSSVLDIWFSQKTYQVSHIAIKIARKHAFTTVVDQRNDGIFFMFLSTVCWINMESSKGKMYIRSSIGCIILSCCECKHFKWRLCCICYIVYLTKQQSALVLTISIVRLCCE